MASYLCTAATFPTSGRKWICGTVCQFRASTRPQGQPVHRLLSPEAQPTRDEVFGAIQLVFPHPVAEHQRGGERRDFKKGIQQFSSETAQQHQREEGPGRTQHTQSALRSSNNVEAKDIRFKNGLPPLFLNQSIGII
ncbi:UNVERIFIED_CONTAM: hypothetical protein NCL1_52391 [Trichonephila clavipes]